MFSLASGIYQSYFAPPKLSILIIGLDGSGKTALLERIKVTSFATHVDNTSSHEDKYIVGAVAGANLDKAALNRGARPARLPPPLPPNKARQSRNRVDELLAADEAAALKSQASEQQINNEKSSLLQGIPPPPLCGLDTSQSSNGSKSTLSSNKSQRPPLPTVRKTSDNPTTPTSTPAKRSSFIQLLRCPSPQRYSSAALGEEDEVEYNAAAIHASALSAICTSAQKAMLEDQWNTNYLNDYFINYSEEEQFDVKMINGNQKKMFPLERIRPTLGQNLAKNVDICGCKCSLFDLSGAAKMRPLWERYYRDTDAIVYVIDSSDDNFNNIQQSRDEFIKLCENEVLKKRLERGLPLMIWANGLDLAYAEYDRAVEKANEADRKRQVSWNSDEEDAFVGGTQQESKSSEKANDEDCVSERALDFGDLLRLFGMRSSQVLDANGSKISVDTFDNFAQCNGNNHNSMYTKDNIFLFGGSAKSGEGVKSAMEYLVAQAKQHYLVINSQ